MKLIQKQHKFIELVEVIKFFSLSLSLSLSISNFNIKKKKGAISIKEICFDAKYVILENSGSRGDVDISNWTISRKIDDNDENIFIFPQNTLFKANSTIKVWAVNQGKSNNRDEFVHHTEWGTGDLIITRVLNNQNSERALHNQRTAQ